MYREIYLYISCRRIFRPRETLFVLSDIALRLKRMPMFLILTTETDMNRQISFAKIRFFVFLLEKCTCLPVLIL
ncbi:unnamed protein product [Acanthoscelides obtectus]|uniref:Uncharacterized protein n=1 Tax=Acanthoscelides obtectus TaxID=200917 RepID=A0A9P0KDY6_ACAOB|nr:unnamed protein product [Acanthoscelides obtectus]CAK1669289.1 hypothetical protein AOBTE_LOCUS26930 [Acanthoscelides obtectus]